MVGSSKTQEKIIDAGGDLLGKLLDSAVKLLVLGSTADGSAIFDTLGVGAPGFHNHWIWSLL